MLAVEDIPYTLSLADLVQPMVPEGIGASHQAESLLLAEVLAVVPVAALALAWAGPCRQVDATPRQEVSRVAQRDFGLV